jgi:hypothetical protein
MVAKKRRAPYRRARFAAGIMPVPVLRRNTGAGK